MSTPSSNDDQPGEGEPRDGTTEPEGGRARDEGEPAAGARRDDRADGDGDYDPFIAEETEDEEPLDAEGQPDTDTNTAAAVGAGRRDSGGGVAGAETFAVASVLALAGALVGPRLVQMFSSVTAQDQVSAISGTIVGDALVALVGVVLGLLGIGLADEHTRPWARWVSGAAVLLGILFAVLSVVAYLLVPAPTPAPMGPQM